MEEMNWFRSLPPAEACVPCGSGSHAVRWEAGKLVLVAHPDAEAELVLGALGGDKPHCIELAETWARHADDLEVLMMGPRSAADQVRVEFQDAEENRATWFGKSPLAPPGAVPMPPGASRTPRRLHPVGSSPARAIAEEMTRRVQARTELLELMAVGPAFQFRLAGTVTASWAEDSRAVERTRRRPELTAALTGRLA